MAIRGRIAGPLFAALKVAWDAANLQARFPGGYVAGQRITRPARLPALQPWPLKEASDVITNKGGVFDFNFEVGIVGETFEMATDWKLTKALEDATFGITANGAVTLDGGMRLLGFNNVADGAHYVEQPPDLFICFVLFSARIAQ